MWSEYSLEVVDAVARNGSFSAAAQELHRVPSAVSYTVRQLEEWLAVPLFDRCWSVVSQRRALCCQKNADHPPAMSADSERLARSVSYRSG